MTDQLTVLVTGATGQQGGAVADHLLKAGHTVRFLTRNPDGDAAGALASRGAQAFAGDFDHPESLKAAADGADTAYLMGTPFEAGTEAETEHGRTAIDAFRAAGVGHVVYSSVGSADRATGIPHFESKFAVEQYLVEAGIPYSISGPVFFADNFLSPWMLPSIQAGNLAMALPADRKLQLVTLADIGEFGAELIERREAVFGKRYDIAGDELTGAEMADVLAKASGRNIAYVELPIDAVRQQSEDMALMFQWFERAGYSADIAALKRDFPQVGWQTLETWASQRTWQSAAAA